MKILLQVGVETEGKAIMAVVGPSAIVDRLDETTEADRRSFRSNWQGQLLTAAEALEMAEHIPQPKFGIDFLRRLAGADRKRTAR